MTRILRHLVCLTLLGFLLVTPPRPGQAGSARGERERGAEQAFDVADAALNKVYQQLLGKIDAPSQKRVREAQRAWLAFRDAQVEARAGLTTRDGSYTSDEFTVEANVDLTSARVEELRDMLKKLEAR